MAKKKILTIGFVVASFILIFMINSTIQTHNQTQTTDNVVSPKNSDTDDWSMFQGNAQHTGTVDTTPQMHNGLVWNTSIGYGGLATPVVVNGLVYVGSYDNDLYCLNAYTGLSQWEYSTGNSIVVPVAVSNGLVYIASTDGYIYCVNAYSGSQHWYNQTYGGVYSPVVSNGLVYAPNDYEQMYCFDANTGITSWTNTTDPYYYDVTSAAVENGLVYAGTAYGELVCWNANTGNEVWKYEPDSYSFTTPAVANGFVYTGRDLLYSGRISCNDANTGSSVWNTDTSAPIDSTPAIANGMVYATDEQGNIYCLNAYSGSLAWESSLNGSIDSSPAVANGFVYVGTENGLFYCLNANTGTIEWEYNTGSEIDSSPAISNGMVYVDNEGSNLYCFPMVMPPSIPLNFTLSTGNRQITLSWNASLSGGSPVTGYNIYRGNSSINEKLYAIIGNVTQYTDTGLTNGQTYFYNISAINSYGEGSTTANESGVPATVPTQPQNLKLVANDKSITLSWSDPSNNGGLPITGYDIYRGSSPGDEVFYTSIGNITTYQDNELNNGQKYYYTVSAINDKGNSPESMESYATPSTFPSNGMSSGENLAFGLIGAEIAGFGAVSIVVLVYYMRKQSY